MFYVVHLVLRRTQQQQLESSQTINTNKFVLPQQVHKKQNHKFIKSHICVPADQVNISVIVGYVKKCITAIGIDVALFRILTLSASIFYIHRI